MSAEVKPTCAALLDSPEPDGFASVIAEAPAVFWSAVTVTVKAPAPGSPSGSRKETLRATKAPGARAPLAAWS